MFRPQLDREGRVELVKRLQSSTQWNFDFFFLMCLATMLAALGLSLNSPPVVIGAMLVAPLMTPMIGVGLSVVQGNKSMASTCLMTIARGLLVAFLTSCVIAVIRICITSGVTEQMSHRGAPGIVDLMVAFMSGIVAAYAFGRPHLLSVVPGIAIATSLVPPVATAGLALCACELDVALGATLLFFSNFVAIVLGSASSLWFVGMRGPREFCPFAAWARGLMLGMSCFVISLTVYFSLSKENPLVYSASIAGRDIAGRDISEFRKPSQQEHPSDASANKQILIERELENVQVVLEPRATADGEPPVADVTLVVPNDSRPVELKGIVAKQCRPGWIILDLPPLDRWASLMRWLTTRQQNGLKSSDFYDLLEEHVNKRFSSEVAAQM